MEESGVRWADAIICDMEKCEIRFNTKLLEELARERRVTYHRETNAFFICDRNNEDCLYVFPFLATLFVFVEHGDGSLEFGAVPLPEILEALQQPLLNEDGRLNLTPFLPYLCPYCRAPSASPMRSSETQK